LATEENEKSNLTNLKYRYIFAVATLDAVVIYDTQSTRPLAFLGNLHYSFLSDVAWSANGLLLVISSQDGFCTYVEFEEGELGQATEKVFSVLT
jgi:chromatin assembly factor 1 subunit B